METLVECERSVRDLISLALPDRVDQFSALVVEGILEFARCNGDNRRLGRREKCLKKEFRHDGGNGEGDPAWNREGHHHNGVQPGID
jgi:hypothetical protein